MKKPMQLSPLGLRRLITTEVRRLHETGELFLPKLLDAAKAADDLYVKLTELHSALGPNHELASQIEDMFGDAMNMQEKLESFAEGDYRSSSRRGPGRRR